MPDTWECKHGPYTICSYLIVRNKELIVSHIEIIFVNKVLGEEKPTSIVIVKEGLSEEMALS